MTTDVAITFDIEFNINGAFVEPAHRRPRGREGLVCPVNGHDIGLGHILACLAAHGLKATFFVEALQTAWFGASEMGDIARQIHTAGHELQLHLHPVWLAFDHEDWPEMTRREPPVTATHDSLATIPAERARAVIDRGLQVFAGWGLPPPTAVRTGNLIVERPLYRVFADSGLTVSSSVGLGLYQPRDPELQLACASRQFDGVTELPVSSYAGADPLLRRQTRLATIIGMGRREQLALLTAAARDGAPFVMFLSHVNEFFTSGSDTPPEPNLLTRAKFEQLCRTIQRSDDLHAVTISELARRHPGNPERQDRMITVPRTLAMLRLLENTLPGRARACR